MAKLLDIAESGELLANESLGASEPGTLGSIDADSSEPNINLTSGSVTLSVQQLRQLLVPGTC